MGDTGSPYNLPFPELADTPNVPQDVEDLATAVHGDLAALQTAVNALVGFQQRIATTVATSNSSAWDDSPEVSIFSVTASLTAGKIYRIRAIFDILVGTAGDQHFIAIHENSLAGTALVTRRYRGATANNYPYSDEVEFTAVSTASKTFVVGAVRESGSGNGTRISSASIPGYFYVDYIRG